MRRDNMEDDPRSPHPADKEAEDIKPGMEVEAREGDLGEKDVSKPRVEEIIRDSDGNVEKLVVRKGLVFRKTLEVPVERVESVVPASHASLGEAGTDSTCEPQSSGNTADNGTVTLDTQKEEIGALSTGGTEKLRRKPKHKPKHKARSAQASGFTWRDLGPGVLSGMAGNDSSAVTSYSVNGAVNGYGQLWLILLATPLYQAVQYTCARIGRVTQLGLAELLRQHYGHKVSLPASLILITANTALIAADLVAIGTGLQMFTGLAWQWFVVPVAALLWYLSVYKSFGTIKYIFMAMSLAFVAYLITAAFSGADWGAVLKGTLVPQIGFNFASISSAVALLGATVSPYTMYWQVQGEKEQKRAGKTKQQLHEAALDIATGTVSGNLVAYAIIVCTSATLFTHHQTISTAADAARALAPLLGPYAKYLFALGFIGAGLVAIPVLLASTSYTISAAFGWPASLWKKPWQNEGFYLILTGALLVSLVVSLLDFDPIQLMFWANVLQGVLSPVLVVLLLLVGNNRTIMGAYRLGRLTNVGLVVIAMVMAGAAMLLFYGLLFSRRS